LVDVIVYKHHILSGARCLVRSWNSGFESRGPACSSAGKQNGAFWAEQRNTGSQLFGYFERGILRSKNNEVGGFVYNGRLRANRQKKITGMDDFLKLSELVAAQDSF
jgi:hypothetical protein